MKEKREETETKIEQKAIRLIEREKQEQYQEFRKP